MPTLDLRTPGNHDTSGPLQTSEIRNARFGPIDLPLETVAPGSQQALAAWLCASHGELRVRAARALQDAPG
eukprot:249231-Pyramimonas_sp.AAC.1